MPTKRRQCDGCKVLTITKKVAFLGANPDDPSYAWLCRPCREELAGMKK